MPPIFWTPKNGGHWIATRSEDIKYIQQHYEHFSSPRGSGSQNAAANTLDPDNTGSSGARIFQAAGDAAAHAKRVAALTGDRADHLHGSGRQAGPPAENASSSTSSPTFCRSRCSSG